MPCRRRRPSSSHRHLHQISSSIPCHSSMDPESFFAILCEIFYSTQASLIKEVCKPFRVDATIDNTRFAQMASVPPWDLSSLQGLWIQRRRDGEKGFIFAGENSKKKCYDDISLHGRLSVRQSSGYDRFWTIVRHGEMPERPKGHDWKSCIPLITGSRVRLPLSPPSYAKASDGKPFAVR